MTRESFPGYVAPKGPLVHWLLRMSDERYPCGSRRDAAPWATSIMEAVTCEACRRAWREAQEGC